MFAILNGPPQRTILKLPAALAEESHIYFNFFNFIEQLDHCYYDICVKDTAPVSLVITGQLYKRASLHWS